MDDNVYFKGLFDTFGSVSKTFYADSDLRN